MYWNIAPSTLRLVSQRLRQISSALMDLKNVSTMELSKQLPLLLMGALKPSLSGVFGIRVNSIAIPYRYDELTLRVADAVRPPYQEYELRDPFSYDH